MKKFIFNCLKFLGIFLIVCLTSFITNSLLIKANGYKIEKHQNILILGDSHTEYALDDTIFTNSVNLSHSADSYIYSYFKIRKMKKENPQIDTLFLALSNHNLLSEYDDRWLFNTSHIKSKFRIYTDLMNFSDFMFFLKSKPTAVFQGIIELPKYSVKLLFKGGLKERDLGSFKPSKRDKLYEDINNRKLNKTNRLVKYSEAEKEHLFKIAEYCINNNIELIFIGTPLHTEYSKNKSEELDFLKKFYHSELSNFTFLDYSLYEMPDSCFQDVDHLNDKGAKLFTEKVIRDISANN